jgi:hypothetical protein
MTSPLRFFALTFVAGILLIAVLVSIGIGLSVAQRDGEWVKPGGMTFYAYGTDGTQKEIVPGSLVAGGIELSDGSCEVPESSVGSESDGSGGGRSYSSSISTSSDSDCNVWVDRIDWQTNP